MMMKKQVVFGVFLVALLVICLNKVEGARPFLATDEIRFLFQMLQRAPTPPSGGNGCTGIPKGSGQCHG
ncbi:PREDICTED: uncharacterized protein LOC104826208 [Tarenaya hassleriana]|uniref:uncharacterized protein LOC104826208 n=1 Tax=Tarenaya hassleriana TaxID=28532 RepID=UPI00053C5CDA|nr:PREDICTED: uncharacterized protein LOC104826208 [Tarenaya hassleriana]